MRSPKLGAWPHGGQKRQDPWKDYAWKDRDDDWNDDEAGGADEDSKKWHQNGTKEACRRPLGQGSHGLHQGR